MRRILLLVTVLGIVATGCGRVASGGSGSSPTGGGTPIDQRKIDVYEAAIRSPDAEQTALLTALADLPHVSFVHDVDRITQRIFDGKLQGAGLLAVGPLDGDGDRVEVPGEAYCGGLCGHSMTVVVERRPEGWAVSGTTGPVAIS
jgi:hypothetical protein